MADALLQGDRRTHDGVTGHADGVGPQQDGQARGKALGDEPNQHLGGLIELKSEVNR